MDTGEAASNHQILRDCLCRRILLGSGKHEVRRRRGPKGQRKGRPLPSSEPDGGNMDPEDMADFVDYIATELFNSLPTVIQTLSFSAVKSDSHLAEEVAEPFSAPMAVSLLATVPSAVSDSFETYSIVDSTSSETFLISIFQEYVNEATAVPPMHDPSKAAAACEICERHWMPLTYHHLIPRQVQAKVIKRRWHEEWQLNSVAWLCRACHSFVHKIASNEELAKDWWSIELLMSRDDVQTWAKWVSRLRWKGR